MKKVKAKYSNIEEIILLSYSGLMMVSTKPRTQENDRISALAASVKEFVSNSIKEIDWKPFKNILIAGSDQDVLISDIKGIGILAVIAKTGVEWLKFNSYVDYLTSEIFAMTDEKK
jgi:predicted regulator of Ras-like GTPase activity (Roadblock/LC7/MglB family)